MSILNSTSGKNNSGKTDVQELQETPALDKPESSSRKIPEVVRTVAPTLQTPAIKKAAMNASSLGTSEKQPNDRQQGEDDSQEKLIDVREVIRAAPPWLISLIIHAVLLVVLGLLVISGVETSDLAIEIWPADELGDQLNDEEALVTVDIDTMVREQIITPNNLTPVDDPFAAPADLEMSPNAIAASSDLQAPEIGLALTGREEGTKQALLAAYGGNQITEKAVKMALDWFVRQQYKNGTWSLSGPYRNSSGNRNETAATAMALLAFQGAGYTPEKMSPYQSTVAKGWRALLRMQDKHGNFVPASLPNHQRLYSQAQATIAICELYGMTKSSEYREPAQRALNYAYKTQAPEGGWRYFPGKDSDTSVTGWFVMALQSGRMSGLEVPRPVLKRVSKFLDNVSRGKDRDGYDDGIRYRYIIGGYPNQALSAEGLLCRQYLGWKRNDHRLRKGVAFFTDDLINWQEQDAYYWYYATQVLHHMEGDDWDRWNAVMRVVLPREQIKTGREKGSWSPVNDKWGKQAGRLYMTSLCVYMLEVYYRHLPIYASVYSSNK